MKAFIIVFVMMLSTYSLLAQSGAKADKVIGYYLTVDDKTGQEKSQVQIFKATNGKYYGKIVWLAEPLKDGKPKLDQDNPNQELTGKPILGLQLLKGFTYDEKTSEWSEGTIYNPAGGKTYNCFMKFEGNKLKIRGYIGAVWMGLGKTATWTKETQIRNDN